MYFAKNMSIDWESLLQEAEVGQQLARLSPEFLCEYSTLASLTISQLLPVLESSTTLQNMSIFGNR
jgi:hypothetical protein